MERRSALALAIGAAGIVTAASAAFAVNVGLLRHDTTKPVGVLETSALDPAVAADPTVVTVVVDDPAAPASPQEGTPTGSASGVGRGSEPDRPDDLGAVHDQEDDTTSGRDAIEADDDD